VSENAFAPGSNVTRAQFVTMLVRGFGIETASSSDSSRFADVAPGVWYRDAVEAAAAAGIVNGVSGDRFDPNAEITREQMAAMLVRAWEAVNGSITASTGGLSFEDADRVSGWAEDAVQRAVSQGWLQGKGGSKLAPDATATRAESAMLLYNVLVNDYR